jgi:chromosome segregation ATPase
MEGDVILSGLSLPALLAVGGVVLGGVFALLKWFAARLLEDIEQRLERIDDVDSRMKSLIADLPLHYQRRDDAIREMAQADERYQRAVEQIIKALRDELSDARRRIDAIERDRDADIRRFQLRDDAIREYTSLNAKIDRIYEVMMELRHER